MRIHASMLALVGCVAISACIFPRRASVEVESRSVWVCHGERNRTWRRIDVREGDAHRQHGDRVVTYRQNEGRGCDNVSDERDRRDRR